MLLKKRSCQKLVRQKGKITIIVAVASFLVTAVVSLMPAILIGKKQIATTSAGTPMCKSQNKGQMEGATCKNYGEWCLVCVGRQGPCPSDSGVALPFQCVNNNGGLVWQNQNRLGECNTTCAVSPTPGSGASPPVNKPPAPSSSPVGNSCFTLSANFEARPPDSSKGESGTAAFYAWVTFNSQTAGDVKLDFNNQHLAGWNGFAGGSFTYSPQWTQPYTHSREAAIAALEKGRSFNVEYTGWLRNCDPQTATIRCNLKVNNKGVASVSGGGCSCSNCGQIQTQPQPVTTKSPAPTYRPITPIIRPRQNKPTSTQDRYSPRDRLEELLENESPSVSQPSPNSAPYETIACSSPNEVVLGCRRQRTITTDKVLYDYYMRTPEGMCITRNSLTKDQFDHWCSDQSRDVLFNIKIIHNFGNLNSSLFISKLSIFSKDKDCKNCPYRMIWSEEINQNDFFQQNNMYQKSLPLSLTYSEHGNHLFTADFCYKKKITNEWYEYRCVTATEQSPMKFPTGENPFLSFTIELKR